MTSARVFAVGLVVVLGIAPGVVFGQKPAAKTLVLQNQSAARGQFVFAITVNVTNKSRTAVTGGTILFDDGYADCDVDFGAIAANGGTASGTCNLDSAVLVAKVAFNAANNTAWFGVTGDGQPFDHIDVTLGDPK